MDESNRLYSIKSQDEKIIFNENSFNGHSNGDISEEFARYFSIDDDDDDVVLLDDSQVIHYEVQTILNNILNNILDQEKQTSQIKNFLSKRLLDSNNDDEYSLNKKVRFNISDEEEEPSPYLFISETFNSSNQLKPYTQFLYNLGFDLCLEQNSNENPNLSEIKKQTLIKYNKIFHQYKNYSCEYCSFKTNTIHVMNYHYRTPHIYHNDKYRCTYCSFLTFSLSVLRRHYYKKHKFILIPEPNLRRYPCSYCSYETQDRHNFYKHNKRCQVDQRRTRIANNLLAPIDQLNRNNNNIQISTNKNKNILKNNKNQMTTESNPIETFEPILIESDHDSSSLSRRSSDEDFVVSSDEESSSSGDDVNISNQDIEIPTSRPIPTQQFTSKPTKLLISQPISFTQPSNNHPSLQKLLLLNGTPIPSYTSSQLNSNKSLLIPIQPKPASANDIYQMCRICQCYIFKNDYIKHMNEKHPNPSLQPQSTNSNPIIILNNPNTSITCLKPPLIISKGTPPSIPTILLLSTSTMNSQTVTLNMIKCPWCDTNFEHIDIMTGHLMRYHRMTLAAAKVVVAEQMKIQGTLSKDLSAMFKLEIEKIQNEFTDKIYWKISQPKIYLHQIENFLCFFCNINIDDIENHFSTSHQIQLTTMTTIKQCCLCGVHCNKKNSSLFEHQLRMHSGVCYSSVLKQFIRFEPPPPPLSKTNNRLVLSSSSSQQRVLTTYTEKKFGCRKCDRSSGLFTFEKLVEHLRLNHNLNVKLHRRCIICQQTFLKGKEYNQHCLEHLNDENPLIKIQRKYLTKN